MQLSDALKLTSGAIIKLYTLVTERESKTPKSEYLQKLSMGQNLQ